MIENHFPHPHQTSPIKAEAFSWILLEWQTLNIERGTLNSIVVRYRYHYRVRYRICFSHYSEAIRFFR